MDIQSVFRNMADTCAEICKNPGQSAMTFAMRCKTLRNDPDFFQKVCQVFYAVVQLIMERNPEAKSLSQFAFVLHTANMHDFWLFLKQPRKWFFPISADVIDENALLPNLVNALKKNTLGSGLDDDALQQVARSSLEEQLKSMGENNDSYRDAGEFKECLRRRINHKHQLDLTEGCFDALDITLRHVSPLKKVINGMWGIVDIGCIVLCFQGWKLVDTAKQAERIGQYPGFQWVKSGSLDTRAVGFVSLAFALQVVEAVRKLQFEALSEQDRNQAYRDIVTSFFESVFYGSIYLRNLGYQSTISFATVQCLAILAKTLGLIAIVTRPTHKYFEPAVAA